MNQFNQEFDFSHALFSARSGLARGTLRFCIGSGNSSSSSPTTNQSLSQGSGAGSSVISGEQAQQVGPGSVGIGADGKYLESGASELALTQSGSSKVTTGYDLSNASNINISDPSIGLAQDSLNSLRVALVNAQDQISDQARAVNNALLNATAPAKAIPATATGASSSSWPTWLKAHWLLVAGLALAAGFLFFKRKRAR